MMAGTPWCWTERAFLLVVAFVTLRPTMPALGEENPRVLVFTKTAGFRHESIADGIALVQALGRSAGLQVDTTEDAAEFTDENLQRYRAVVWLNTTGDVFDERQEGAFERYIRSGGGYVGVHSAADTEHGWSWYGALLGGGAWFKSHPAIQEARLAVEDRSHLSTEHLPPSISMSDEWYNFKTNPRPFVNVLININESTYDPGPDRMGDHPISWYHELDGGRGWYTNFGHRSATYASEAFQQHLLGGILWAAGCGARCGPLPTPPPAPTVTPVVCTGDCDGDGEVTVDELVQGVNIALGLSSSDQCATFDTDLNAEVTIDELIRGVNEALNGCGASVAPAFLVRDINQRLAPTSSSPAHFVRRGRTTFFVASTPATGAELWRTDGTEGRTGLVKDIRTGPEGSAPEWLHELGGRIFFTAEDGIHARTLWVSDGTAEGTMLVRAIPTGIQREGPRFLFGWNQRLFFITDERQSGLEVWSCDGTPEGTLLLGTSSRLFRLQH